MPLPLWRPFWSWLPLRERLHSTRSSRDHAVGCASCGLYARHNHLRSALAHELALAGLPVATEVSPPGSSQRPADVLVSFPCDSHPTALDCSVGHPLHLSSSLAAVTPGILAEQMEKSKRAENTTSCAAAGWCCSPVCVETTGAWGSEGQRLERCLVKL